MLENSTCRTNLTRDYIGLTTYGNSSQANVVNEESWEQESIKQLQHNCFGYIRHW